ncbi:MAG: DUF433 domain-containing protein [Verrucomicrobia bacterium]|nr:DUF433 domain-containing protein [Verrucomicrobiota bacterium]
MTTAAPTSHVWTDDKGVAWIDDANVKVVEVMAEHLAHGVGPEQIHQDHPSLSLAQIFAAFAYYHDHRVELDAEMERRHQGAEALKEEAPPFLTRKELLSRLPKP